MGLSLLAAIPNQGLAVKCRVKPTLHNQGLMIYWEGRMSRVIARRGFASFDWTLRTSPSRSLMSSGE
jgi:hypothetical protein